MKFTGGISGVKWVAFSPLCDNQKYNFMAGKYFFYPHTMYTSNS